MRETLLSHSLAGRMTSSESIHTSTTSVEGDGGQASTYEGDDELDEIDELAEGGPICKDGAITSPMEIGGERNIAEPGANQGFEQTGASLYTWVQRTHSVHRLVAVASSYTMCN